MNVLHIDSVDFTGMSLGEPVAVQGGSFYAKIYVCGDDSMWVQLPRCSLKQGIVSTKRGKYCDLMYDRDASQQLAAWVEAFEGAVQDRIDTKKHLWFQGDLTRGDIETMMAPVSRSYRSGRCTLVRAHLEVDRRTGADRCVVYDEAERLVGAGTIDADHELVPLLHLAGIRFTSRSFEVDVKLVQAMVLAKRPSLQDTCLIKVGANIPLGAHSRLAGDTSAGRQADNDHTDEEQTDNDHTDYGWGGCRRLAEHEPAKHELVDPELVEHEPVEHELVEPELVDPEPASVELANPELVEHQLTEPELVEHQLTEPELGEPVGGDLAESGVAARSDRPSVDSLETHEISLDVVPEGDAMVLREPADVYMEIYRNAREKAKRMRKAAADAYLEARRIRSHYLLDEIDSSDECGDNTDPHSGSAL
jgi:hypothetical protein